MRLVDFRKLCDVEAYAVTDNVSELTARINDEGWDTSYANWLRASRLRTDDCVFAFSVGGGDVERGISVNLVEAMHLAHDMPRRSRASPDTTVASSRAHRGRLHRDPQR